MAKEKQGSSINPMFLKLGVTLVFSLGGIVFTFLRIKRVVKSCIQKPPLLSSGKSTQGDSRGGIGELVNNDCALQNNLSPQKVPLCDQCNGDRNSFLSEFDQFLRECNMPEMPYEISRSNNGESLVPEAETPTDNIFSENEEYGREIQRLRSKVTLLEERERILEIQLLEYFGLKEQETTVMELHNRLKLSNMEAKLYKVKIESLHSENRRLELLVTDYAKVVAELEFAEAKIEQLRTILSSKAEKNREQILNLKERVAKLQDDEKKAVGLDRGIDIQLQKMKELEEELDEVQKSNHSLKLENCELKQKFECVQMLATSHLDNEMITALKEEGRHLRLQNKDLRKEIEQIQADRCKDIEELVYLRWINACLRYELRNYLPDTGKATVARDLSITLSPKSEERAKELILEYANKEGYGDEVLSISDFDSDHWFSHHTDSGEADGSNHSSKTEVFTKLMKLWRGKENKHHSKTPIFPVDVALSVNDTADRAADAAANGLMRPIRTSSDVSPSHYFDVQRSYSTESSNYTRRTSGDQSLTIFRSIGLINGYNDNPEPPIRPHQEAQNAAKAELMKFAEALKNSRAKGLSHQRSASAF